MQRSPSLPSVLDVDYDDVTGAAEAIQIATPLMRTLDRVETRISS